jgi:hypothetical protein
MLREGGGNTEVEVLQSKHKYNESKVVTAGKN